MKEQWKNIQDYEDLYQVSDYGRIKSLKRKNRLEERILKSVMGTDGYLRIKLYKNCKAKKYYIHRLVAMVFLDNPLHLSEINHLDGIKQNNHTNNLLWCTRSQNMQHASKNGFLTFNHKGERNPNAKLTEKNIQEIKLYLQNGVTQVNIATLYGVGQTQISRIKLGESWNEK